MQGVLLRIGRDFPEKLQWATARKEGGVVILSGSLAEAASACKGEKVAVLVPGEEVYLAVADIPGGNMKSIRQAVPYALEEQLAADVETLHFALGQRAIVGGVPVAVIDRDRISFWLKELREVGIDPYFMTPDIFAVPYEENSWSLLVEDENALIRTGARIGYSIEVRNIRQVLETAFSQLENKDGVIVHLYDLTSKLPGDIFPEGVTVKDADLRTKAAGNIPLRLFADGFNEKVAINLLQGDFKRHAEWDKALKVWRLPLLLLAVFLLLYGGMTGGDYWRLRRESKDLSLQMENLYLQTFPDAKKVVNPKAQMEHRLSQLTGGDEGAGRDFLTLLVLAAKHMTATAGYRLQGMQYKEHKLDFDFQVADLAALDDFKIKLAADPSLEVEIKSATAQSGHVSARLQIRQREIK